MFLDAPIVLHPVDLADAFGTDLSSLGASEASQEDPALLPRGWWKANKDRTSSEGLESTVEYLRDTVKDQKFDVSLLFHPRFIGILFPSTACFL